MKKKYVILSFVTISLLLVKFSVLMLARTSGAGIAANTNAPGESNCSGCHSGTALQTTALQTANLILAPNFSGGGYFMDSTYTMTLAFKKTSTSKFGFSLTVLEETTNNPVGTLTAVVGSTQASTSTVSSKLRTYISHTSATTASTSTDSIYWSFKWKAPSTNVGNVKFYAVVNATNSSSSTAGDVIYAKTFTYGLSSLYPVADANAVSTAICQKQSVHLLGSATNTPTAYEWKMPGANISTDTAKNPVVTYASSGQKTIVLRAKNQYGWGAWDTLRVNILTAPSVTILGADSVNICQGDSVRLFASFQANTRYLWSPGNSTGNNLWVSQAGDYSVTATNNSTSCSTKSNTVKVRVIAKPTISISSTAVKDTLCNLFPIEIVSSNKDFDSIQVFVNNSFNQTTTNDTFQVFANTNDSALITAIAFKNGCSSVISNTVKKYLQPTQSAPILTCGPKMKDKIRITWTAIANINNYEITLDTGNTWLMINKDSSGYTIDNLNRGKEMNIGMRSVSNTSCPKSGTNFIVCGTEACLQNFTSISRKSLICANEMQQIVVKGIKSNRYSISINGGSPFQDSVINFRTSKDSIFNIAVVDSNQLSCGAKTESISIQVQTSPQFLFSTPSANPLCYNEDVRFKIEPKLNDYTYYFAVSTNNSPFQKIDSGLGVDQVRYKAQGDSFALLMRVSKGVCTSELSSQKMVYPELNFNLNHKEDWYYQTLTASNKSYTYLWKDSSGSEADLTGDSLVYLMAGKKGTRQKFYATATDNNNCEKTDSITFNVSDFLSVKQISNELLIYPSPTKGLITIRSNNSLGQTFGVIDLNGKHLMKFEVQSNEQAVNCAHLPDGIYFINNAAGQKVGQFVILK